MSRTGPDDGGDGAVAAPAQPAASTSTATAGANARAPASSAPDARAAAAARGDAGFAAGLEASLVMAQCALVVRREALDALLGEVAALRAENDVLAAAVTDPAFDGLRRRLKALEVGARGPCARIEARSRRALWRRWPGSVPVQAGSQRARFWRAPASSALQAELAKERAARQAVERELADTAEVRAS
jgi:hypothetical protein